MSTLPEIIGAFISDAVTVASTATGSPVPGALVGSMLSEYLHRRAAKARDILIEELRRAEATEAQVASQDAAIAVIWRFLRASIEGTARLNLRLLAKAIAGKLQSGRLVADEFLQYSEALGSLSRDEILVIGVMYRHWKLTETLAVQPRNDDRFRGRLTARTIDTGLTTDYLSRLPLGAGTLSSSAGSHSSTVASLAMISSPR